MIADTTTATPTVVDLTTEFEPRAAARFEGGIPCQIETANRERGRKHRSAEVVELAVVEEVEGTGVAAAVAVPWALEAPASVPSVASVSLTTPGFRASKSDARAVAWQWCAKDRPTIKKSRVVAPGLSKTTLSRAFSFFATRCCGKSRGLELRGSDFRRGGQGPRVWRLPRPTRAGRGRKRPFGWR